MSVRGQEGSEGDDERAMLGVAGSQFRVAHRGDHVLGPATLGRRGFRGGEESRLNGTRSCSSVQRSTFNFKVQSYVKRIGTP